MSEIKVKRLKMGSLVSIHNEVYPVYKGLNPIGRNKEATVIIKDTEISHHHAIITIVDENNQYVSDFGSCNGVFVDNKRLNPLELCKIHDGMVIKFSTIDFTFNKDTHNLEETLNQRNTQAHESVYSAATQYINESALGNTQNQIPDDGFDFSTVDTQTIENNTIPTENINDFKRSSSETDNIQASTSAGIPIGKTIAQNEGETEKVREKNSNALDELSEDSFDFNTVNTPTEIINESNKDKKAIASNDVSGDGFNTVNTNSKQNSPSKEENEMHMNSVRSPSNDEMEIGNNFNGIEMGPITQAMDEELDRMERISEMCTQILPVRNNDSIHEAPTQIIDCLESSTEDEKSVADNINIYEAATQMILENNQANGDQNNDNLEDEFDTDRQSQLHLSQLTKKCSRTVLDSQDFDEEVVNTEGVEDQVVQERDEEVVNTEVVEEQVVQERDEEIDDSNKQNESKKCVLNIPNQNKNDSVDEKIDSDRGDDSGSDTDVEGNINANSKFMNSMTDVEESFIEKPLCLDSTDSIIPETQEYNDSFKASTSRAGRFSNFTDVIPCSQEYSSEDLSLRITSSASSNDEKKLSTIEEKSEIHDDEDVIESDDEVAFPTSNRVLPHQDNDNEDAVSVQWEFAETAQKSCEETIDDDCDTEEFDIAAATRNVILQSNTDETNVVAEENTNSDTEFDFDCATQKVNDSSMEKKESVNNIEPIEIVKIQAVNEEVTIDGNETTLIESSDIDFNCPTQRIVELQENSTISLQKNQSKDSLEMDTNSLFAAQTQKIDGEGEDDVCDTDSFDFGAPTQKVELQSKSESDEDGDSLFLAATQKIENSPKNDEVVDDFDFVVPTQPLAFKTNHKKQATNAELDLDAPTQIISNISNESTNTDSFYDYDLPTQKVCNKVAATVQEEPDDKRIDDGSDDDFDFMAPTQKVSSNTYENNNKANSSKYNASEDIEIRKDPKSKDKVSFEMDSDFNTPTQDILSNSIKINDLLETQPLEDVPVINEPRIESQLEVMFDTETVHYQENAECRPSNPMASVLIESSTQDILGMLENDSENNKTPGKRMSNSKPDCEKPAKKPKEDISNEVCSAIKRESTENKKTDVTNISEDLNDVDKQNKNYTEQSSGESSCNEAMSSWSKKFSRLSTKRNVKNSSDEELINDNNDLMDMDFTNMNNDANTNIDNVTILIEDSNDNELIILEDNSNDKEANNDEDDNDNINKSAKKLRRKTHALVDDDLESQNMDTSAPSTSSDNKTPKRTLRTRKPSESKPNSNLYIVNLDNPDVSDFVETKVKMTKRRKSEANDILKNLDSVIIEGKRKRRGAPRKIAKIEEDSSDEDDGKITFTVPKKQPQLKISDTEDGETVAEVILSRPKVLLKRGRKTKKEKESGESTHEASDLNISVASRAKRIIKHKVCFTLCDEPGLTTIIRTLGGTVIDDVDKCTVLITKHVQRTMKLLRAIGLKIPICSPNWLNDSKSKGSFLDPWDYLIVDEEAETKWSFSLKESFNRSNSVKLFSGYFFQLQVTQSVDVLKGAIEGSGGKVVSRMPKAGNFVVVSAPENKKKFEKYLKQGVVVVSTESIFDGVLRQEIVFNKYLLK
ncbi:PREDICTED: myb-like protein X [Nicrophorus vespilloides]|uniref:Mediator of DNA damage checkpoint protein 1 n=1 Tax=Nicrophorus vespilloides TaxID=110193 RepID=A0ABM1MD85_NICVS|nr:PREDICTED: myb-like protein X [Nicrophorus vespilloides]